MIFGLRQITHETKNGDPGGEGSKLVAFVPHDKQRLLKQLANVGVRLVVLKVGSSKLCEAVLGQVFILIFRHWQVHVLICRLRMAPTILQVL